MIVDDFIYNVIIFCIVLILTISLYSWIKEYVTYPPGPYNIPFIGYIPFILDNHPYKLLAKLRYKYGSLFGFHLGQRYIIVLNEYKIIKDLISKDEFLNRPNTPPMSIFHEKSLVPSNGDTFKREKRNSMKIFHKLCFEGKFLENVIREEISCLINELKNFEGKPYNIRLMLRKSATNNISSLLFGRRFHYEDFRARSLIEGVQLFDECDFYGDPAVFFPFLKPFLSFFGDFLSNKTTKWKNLLESIISLEVKEHKEKFDENHITDYIDGYLVDIKRSPLQDEDSLIGTSEAFFIGGVVTISTTLEWFLMAMAIHQDIQSRCFKEIKEAIGLEKSVEMSDFKALTYIRATMLEVRRWKTVTPLSLVRSISKNLKYNGYTLPKNAFVFVNIWAVHNDPNIWKKPEEFNPENFLDKDGNIINSEYCIPFSIGKRSCPGENIANIETFLYMVSLLQKYSFHPPENEEFDLEGISLLTHYPKPFKIVFRPRV